MRKNARVFVAAALLLAVACGAICSFTQNAAARGETLKVAWFVQPGYQELGADGKPLGYNYEYLTDIGRRAGWSYEYISGDFAQLYDMVKQGEVDIIGCLFSNEERAAELEFSALPAGSTSTTLFTREDSELEIGAFRDYNGITVAVNTQSDGYEYFLDFEAEHGFEAEIIHCDDSDELYRSLASGKVDAAVVGGYVDSDSTRPLASFAPADFYFAVAPDNPQLLSELNSAMNQIQTDDPYYNMELYRRYFGLVSHAMALADDERQYVQSAPPIALGYSVSWEPLLKVAPDGKASGIIASVYKRVSELTGLSFYYVPAADMKHDILAAVPFDQSMGDYGDGLRTDPYLRFQLVDIYPAGRGDGTKSIAGAFYLAPQLIKLSHAGEQVQTCPSSIEAVRAVIDGRAEHAVIDSYTAGAVLTEPGFGALESVVLQNMSLDVCATIVAGADHRLAAVVDKCLSYIAENEMNDIILAEAANESRMSMMQRIERASAETIVVALVVVAVITLIIAGAIFTVQRRRSERLLEGELIRFVEYTCDANDEVSELDFATNTRHVYNVFNRKLVKTSSELFTAGALFDGLHAEDLEAYGDSLKPESLRALVTSGESLYMTVRRQSDNAEYRFYSYLFQPMKQTAKRPCSIMLYKRDVTESQRAADESHRALQDALEMARQASEAKGQFTSRMSHEIRTPLNAIIGYNTIARNSLGDGEKLKGCLEKSAIASQHLLTLINDVLDMSSIESGRLKLAKEPFDLSLVLSSLVTVFGPQAESKGVAFRLEFDDSFSDRLVGDQLRVNQILMNLLSNAVKFTSEGEIVLSARPLTRRGNILHMRFQVSDTGIGMTDEYMSRLFTPYEQQNAGIARKFGGTGLGLSICKNLATMMDGAITVKSKPGEGSCFTVELPFNTELSAAGGRDMPNTEGVRALVVDDEPVVREHNTLMLEHCGIHAECVGSGGEAMAAVRGALDLGTPYTLCLLDWCMDDMDGLETAKAIMAMYAGQNPPEIIMVTAYSCEEVGDDAAAAGVSRLLQKPVSQEDILDVLIDIYGVRPPKTETGEARASELSGRRLLLVEDNEMNREIAEELLRSAGLVIECAADGREAVDKFSASPEGWYDGILMDIIMPVMDGYQAAREIRAGQHPQAKTIPIIAMTANAFTEDVSEAIAAGMNDHASKPIDLHKLLELIAKYV